VVQRPRSDAASSGSSRRPSYATCWLCSQQAGHATAEARSLKFAGGQLRYIEVYAEALTLGVDVEYTAGTLLHELGHVLGCCSGPGTSGGSLRSELNCTRILCSPHGSAARSARRSCGKWDSAVVDERHRSAKAHPKRPSTAARLRRVEASDRSLTLAELTIRAEPFRRTVKNLELGLQNYPLAMQSAMRIGRTSPNRGTS